MIMNSVNYFCLTSILEEKKMKKQIYTEKMMFSRENPRKEMILHFFKFSIFELFYHNASDSKKKSSLDIIWTRMHPKFRNTKKINKPSPVSQLCQ